MRRLITVILILTLALPAAALADHATELKWKKRFLTLSDEELSDANTALQLLMFERMAAVNGAYVPAGNYIVGEDIPAGTYRIEYRPLTDTSFCSFLAINEETDFGYTTTLGFDSSNEIGKIELTDGTNITLFGGDIYFYTYTGLFH